MMPRRKPFSAKQKKKQLQERKERKRSDNGDEWQSSDDADIESEAGPDLLRLDKIGSQSDLTDHGQDINRYRLHFFHENNDEIHKKKELSRIPYKLVAETALEMNSEEIYHHGSVLDMPKRPPWDYNQKKAQLDSREERYFKEYLKQIYEEFDPNDLSYFELNLENWRQLWRVLEMSDILLLIADIRYPALHFPPALYSHVTNQLKKKVILMLNKIDLVPPAVVVAWKYYFLSLYPELEIVCFTSFPKESKDSSDPQRQRQEDPAKLLHRRRNIRRVAAVGQKELLDICDRITEGKVDLSGWHDKIRAILEGEEVGHEAVVIDDCMEEQKDHKDLSQTSYRDGLLTIGCVGYPNVGKSSLLNGLVGKKVVSVSKTPGHTKHFQTIFLTPTVKLCDCPGLVFPSLVHKSLQIIAGIYPIAQVREPYSTVGYLAERLDLPKLLHLTHPNSKETYTDPDSYKWSGFYVCYAWAEKRGFITAKAGRADVYRGANNLLRMALEGQLCLYFRPPSYTSKKDYWFSLPETEALFRLQEQHFCRQKIIETSDDQMASSEDDEADKGGLSPLDKTKHFFKTRHEGPHGGAIASRNPFEMLSDD